MVKRKIPSPRWESNPRTPIVQPVAQRWWRENFPASAGTRTPDHPALSPALYHWAIRAPFFFNFIPHLGESSQGYGLTFRVCPMRVAFPASDHLKVTWSSSLPSCLLGPRHPFSNYVPPVRWDVFYLVVRERRNVVKSQVRACCAESIYPTDAVTEQVAVWRHNVFTDNGKLERRWYTMYM
jgi:hypothetical protein